MIQHEALSAAVKHALADCPKEIVGYTAAGLYRPLRNSSDKPDEFRVAPADTVQMYEDGIEVFLHSHTDGSDFPSLSDINSQIEMGVPWGVLVLSKDQDGKPYLSDTFFFGDQAPIPAYLGRKFRHYVTDCYALCRDWYRQERHVILPQFPREYEWWEKGGNMIRDEFVGAGFVEQPLSDIQIGDLIPMAVGRGIVNHLGVYIGNGQMIHHMRGRQSNTDSVVRWKHHLTGYILRHVGT